MATNIQFGSYTPKPQETTGKEFVIGIFFDGTLNNKTNTEGRLAYNKEIKGEQISDSDRKKVKAFKKYGIDDETSSYQNEYSNVARIWEGYDMRQRIYVEGIGSTDIDDDDTPGYAFGAGETGIVARVEKGCELLADKLPKGQKIITVLKLDVFGFSRGATAARHFVSEVSKPEIKGTNPMPAYGYLAKYLQTKQITVKRLEIRFLGIYDTVSSYEPKATSVLSIDAINHNFKNDVAELSLNNIQKAKCVLHLTAENEHRENFALTRTHVGLERSLPGVHCDIGGSYPSGREKVPIILEGSTNQLETEKFRLVQQGWYLDDELAISFWGPNHELSGKRMLKHTYSYVPLHIMVDYAKQFDNNIPINKQLVEDIKYDISKDQLLLRAKKKLKNYVFNNGDAYTFKWFKEVHSKYKGVKTNEPRYAEYQRELQEQKDLRALRHGYLHWSANYKGVGMDPTPNRVRVPY